MILQVILHMFLHLILLSILHTGFRLNLCPQLAHFDRQLAPSFPGLPWPIGVILNKLTGYRGTQHALPRAAPGDRRQRPELPANAARQPALQAGPWRSTAPAGATG